MGGYNGRLITSVVFDLHTLLLVTESAIYVYNILKGLDSFVSNVILTEDFLFENVAFDSKRMIIFVLDQGGEVKNGRLEPQTTISISLMQSLTGEHCSSIVFSMDSDSLIVLHEDGVWGY